MTPTTPTHRASGLDTLRAVAIVLVFMYHYMVFGSREPTFGWASVVGWVGVDLFFVLSGYLIANQLFGGMTRGQRVSLPRFYARRALRTLPVFWLVLALYFLLPTWMGGRTPPPLWRFLSFTQNLGLQPGTAFSHAWSLCIEEQFYLVLPVVLIAGWRLRATLAHGWALLVALICMGIAARAWLWTVYGPASDGYYPYIYYATLCRFDEFLPGVAVAMLKNFSPAAWARVTQHGQRVFALGIAAVLTMLTLVYHFYDIDGYGYGFFMTAFGYSLVAMAFSLLVVAALSPGSALHRWRIPGAARLALWSYSIYLSHKAVMHAAPQLIKALAWPAGTQLAITTAGSLVVGALLYRLVEAPFMAWRDRLVPTNFAAPHQASDSRWTSQRMDTTA